MRRIEASSRKARAVRERHSQSLASRRQRLSQAKVRSTIRRLGSTTKPLAERVRRRPFILRGLVAELAERGVKTDRRAVWVFVRAQGLSFKKNAAGE